MSAHEAPDGANALDTDDPAHAGLPGQRTLMSELDGAIALHALDNRPFALLVILLPELPLNRVQALYRTRVCAARLNAACLAQESPAKLDGAGFAVRLPPASAPFLPGVLRRARELRAALTDPLAASPGSQPTDPLSDRDDAASGAQVGVALYPADGQSAAALLEAARRAAAAAARQGGLACHQVAANAPILREWELSQALQGAIDRDELRLMFQPKVSLKTGLIAGVEILLRWDHPSFGELLPGDFLPLAERSRCIERIDHWVLRQACLQAVDWHRTGWNKLRLAVNFSQINFHLADFAKHIQTCILETGADPSMLTVELTEGSVMADAVHSVRILRELKAIGIELALDNFGIGSSSLAVLESLPIDVLNIDRSLVHDVTASPESVSLTRGIIQMAHGMKLQVLAEGVETEGQIGLLAAKGCDYIQGHVFSGPVSAEALLAMLREPRTLDSRQLRRPERQRTLLLVDDEENILAALKRLMRRNGYRILTALSGDEGLQRLSEEPVDVIISDQRMPGISGVEFLRRAKVLYPETVRMTLSGFTELQSIIDAVNEGAIYKFLTKPWDDALLLAHVDEAFRQKELADENRRLQSELAHANAELEALSSRLTASLQAQREQSERLAASALGAHQLLDELPVAVVGLDADDAVVYVNHAAGRLVPSVLSMLGEPADPELQQLMARAPAAGSQPSLVRQGDQPLLVLSHALAGSAATPLGRGRLLLLVPQPDAAASDRAD